jgi:hypothetical protein
VVSLVLCFGGAAAAGCFVLAPWSLVLTAPGVVLAGVVIAVGLRIQWRLGTAQRDVADFADDEEEPAGGLSGIGYVAACMLCYFRPGIAGFYVTPAARLGIALSALAAFVGVCVIGGLRGANAASAALEIAHYAALAVAFLYFGLVGVFLPRRVIERDRALSAFLRRAGLRSVLGLRLAGVLCLLAMAMALMAVLGWL